MKLGKREQQNIIRLFGNFLQQSEHSQVFNVIERSEALGILRGFIILAGEETFPEDFINRFKEVERINKILNNQLKEEEFHNRSTEVLI